MQATRLFAVLETTPEVKLLLTMDVPKHFNQVCSMHCIYRKAVDVPPPQIEYGITLIKIMAIIDSGILGSYGLIIIVIINRNDWVGYYYYSLFIFYNDAVTILYLMYDEQKITYI